LIVILKNAITTGKGCEFMVILLILAIVFALLVGLKFLEGISLSLIIYAVLSVVCLIIYVAALIEKKREARM